MNKHFFYTRFLPLFLILLIYFLNYFYRLGFEYSQPTADLWVNRAYSFMLSFKSGDFAGTYVFYHPGVTVSWFVGFVVWYFPKIQDILYGVVLDPFNPQVFYLFNTIALSTLVLACTLVVAFLAIVIKYFFKPTSIAFLFLFFVATENFFISNVRSIHMDAFVSIFLFGSFITYCSYLYTNRLGYRVSLFTLSSMFFGLSVLTRSNSLIYLPFFIILNFLYLAFNDRNLKSLSKFICSVFVFILISYLTIVVFWPAMWANPITPFVSMLKEGVLSTGLGDDTRSRLVYIFGLGNDSVATKILHYPLIYLFRTNGAFILLGLVSVSGFILNKRKYIKMSVFNKILRSGINFEYFTLLGALAFVVFYIFIISIPDKMIFRYILPIYPFMFLIVAYTTANLLNFAGRFFKITLATLAVLVVVESFSTFPYPMTYYNRYIGGIKASSKVVNTDQAGAGLPRVARDLNLLSPNSTVAVYDSVPFSQYFYGSTKQLKQYNLTNKLVDTNYVVVGVQGEGGYFSIDDSRYELFKVYSYGTMDQWFLYKQIDL